MTGKRVSIKAAVRTALREERKAIAQASPASIGHNSRHRTEDSFQNFQAGVGIGTDNVSSGATYGFNPITRNRILCEWVYRGSWLGGVAVDCIADDMTRAGIQINSTSTPKDNEKLLKRIRVSLNDMGDVLRWARLYGGAIGVYMIDGQDPSTPLRVETIGKGQYKGIAVFDRWMIEPDLSNLVQEFGTRVGEPMYYRVTADAPVMRNAKIHYTRCFRALGIPLPYNQAMMENLWGISVIERLYDRLVAFDSTTQGAAQLVYRAYLRTLSVDKYREIMASGGKPLKGLINGINFMRSMQTNEGMVTIDAKDKFEAHQYSFGGLSDVMLRFSEQICGSIGTVMARLFGQSPSGLSSPGDHELRTYYDTINQRQEKQMREPTMVVSQLCSRSEGITLPPDYDFMFTDLWQLTAKEKSEISQQTETSVSDSVERGLIRRATGLKELRTSSRITGIFTNISDEEIKEAEDEPPPGTEALAGGDEPPKPGDPQESKPPKPTITKKDPLEEKSETQDARRRSRDAAREGFIMNRIGDYSIVKEFVPVEGKRNRKEQWYAIKKTEWYKDVPKFANQAQAESYAKRGPTRDAARVYDVDGIPVYIETAKGEVRQGKGWKTTMAADYGYIDGIGSAEGAFENMDCFVGPYPDSGKVFVINQHTLDGKFDEHKCMLGYRTQGTATADYVRSYDSKGRQRIGSVKACTMDEFKNWLKSGNHRQPWKDRKPTTLRLIDAAGHDDTEYLERLTWAPDNLVPLDDDEGEIDDVPSGYKKIEAYIGDLRTDDEFKETEHPRKKDGEFASKGESGGSSAGPIKVNKRIHKLAIAHGLKAVKNAKVPTYVHEVSKTAVEIHASPGSTQSSVWNIPGVGKGEGLKSFQKALVKALGVTPAQQKVAEEKVQTSTASDWNETLSSKGFVAASSANGKILYKNGPGSSASQIEVDPQTDTWLAQSPGHMTKKGKGSEALAMLLGGKTPVGTPPWENTHESIVDPETAAKQEAAKAKKDQVHTLGKKLTQHRAEPTHEQRSAITSYTGSGYQSINKKLRQLGDAGTTTTTEKIDEWLDNCKLPAMKVWRCVGGEYASMLKSIMFPGSKFMDRGYSSTTINEEMEFGSGQLKFHINIPEGAKGAYVGKGISQHDGEHEVILPRNSKFIVKSFDMKSKHVEVDLEVE